jgi:hypothetical protein
MRALNIKPSIVVGVAALLIATGCAHDSRTTPTSEIPASPTTIAETISKSTTAETSDVETTVSETTVFETGALNDENARGLVERVLADLDLPGVREPPIDPALIPEGALEFGFHCLVHSAGFDINDMLVAFPPVAVGHDEVPGGRIERAEVAILIFDTAASASAVLDAYDAEDTADCLSRFANEPVDVEAADSLEVGGLTVEGFAMSIGEGDIQPEGHRNFGVVVGRMLVSVGVLAPDEGRGRELAEEVLGDTIGALQAGGA